MTQLDSYSRSKFAVTAPALTSLAEIVVGIGAVLLLALFELLTDPRVLQSVILPFAVPVAQSSVRFGHAVVSVFQPFSTWYSSQKLRLQLQDQLAETEGKIVQLEQLQNENTELRRLLENRHLRVKPRRLATPIVSSASPIVWLGETSDVQSGWLVLYKDTVLGQVLSIDGQYARVALLSTSTDINILVQTASGSKGIAKARNGRVVITNTAPEALVTIGERVTTVGQPGVAPGKFVGLVSEVERDPTSAVTTILVDQLVSFYQTSIVEIEE